MGPIDNRQSPLDNIGRMHVLYVHQNFPAQFGHIAQHLVERLGWRCTFVSQTPAGTVNGIEKIEYKLLGGATKHNHFCTRTFENTVWHCDGVYRAMRERPDIKPDLIVGHSGFGSTLFLRELYPSVPVINFFEYYYLPHDPDSDMDFRRDLAWPTHDLTYLRSRCRNAMILLDLQNCQAAYTPTGFQRSRFPEELRPKLRTIFDGVDRSIYHGHDEQLRPPLAQRTERTLPGGVKVGPTTRVVTYVSRGFESMRGFDKFMQAADLIARQYPDVIFVVVGTDRVAYGGDENYIAPHKTFKEWVFAQQSFDLGKFAFVGRLPQEELGKLLASSDLHMYLTVPFVLSWSMMDAMSCGAVVLGSDTAPVREMIKDGENGLLADFFDHEAMAAKALAVLRDPDAARPLGRAAERMIEQRYSLEAVIPEMLRMYEQTAGMASSLPTWPLPPLAPQPPATPIGRGPAPAPRTVGPVVAAPALPLPLPRVPPPPHVPPPSPASRPSKQSPFRG